VQHARVQRNGKRGTLCNDIKIPYSKWPAFDQLEILRSLCSDAVLAQNSWRRWRLLRFADRPTEVKIGVFVISFYSISEQTMVSPTGCVLFHAHPTLSATEILPRLPHINRNSRSTIFKVTGRRPHRNQKRLPKTCLFGLIAALTFNFCYRYYTP